MSLRRWLLPFHIAVIPATVLAAIASFWFAGPSLDMLLALRHAVYGDRHALGDSPTAIIAVDDATMVRPELKDVPFAFWGPQLAVALNALRAAEPNAIGFDIVLGATAESMLPGRDRALIAALRGSAAEGRLVLSEASVAGRMFRPHPVFAFAAGGAQNVRPVNVIADRDGVIRSVPLLLDTDAGIPVAGMALELARRGNPAINATGRSLLLNFSDRAPVPIYSLDDVLTCAAAGDGDALRRAFGNRVLLIGSTIDIEDRKVVSGRMFLDPNLGRTALPCAAQHGEPGGIARTTVPGIIVHAQATNDLLRGETLRRWGSAPSFVCLLLLAALGAVAIARFDIRQGSAGAIGAGLLWTGAAIVAADADQIVPWIGGLAAIGGGYVVMLGYMNLVIDRERKRSILALSRYLDPALARALLAGPKPPELGGETREITVWFSDIANFSTIAEKLSPQDLVARLNAHFGMVAAEIETEGGIIDKFVGDAVVAVFGAPMHQPDHAARAVRAARRVAAVTRDPTQSPGSFAMRIGLNTGEALVGNIGTRRRFDYTAIGDTVNVAQRIEQANKEFGTTVLLSAATAHAAGAALNLTVLGTARVKGRDKSVEVWTLAEDATRDAAPDEQLKRQLSTPTTG